MKTVMNGSTEHTNSINIKWFRPSPVPLGLNAHVKPWRVLYCVWGSPAVRMRLTACK